MTFDPDEHTGDIVTKIARKCATPLWWAAPPVEQNGILHSATATLVRFNGNGLGLTAAHVVQALRRDQDESAGLVTFLGRLEFPVLDRVVSESADLDLCTFRVDASEFDDIGKVPHEVAVDWPPRPPVVGEPVIYAGFPKPARRQTGNLLEFGVDTGVGNVDSVRPGRISIALEHDLLEGRVPPPDYNWGGLSGGPLLCVYGDAGLVRWRLCALMTEVLTLPGAQVLTASPLCDVRSDGVIVGVT